MPPRIATKISLVTAISSAGAVLFGLFCHDERLILVGAIIFVLLGVVELFQAYHEAKLLRTGAWKPEEKGDFSKQFTKWVGSAITLTGLLLVCARDSVAGWIIWGAAVLFYFLSGIIAREVGGIPLTMFYGWKVRRKRNEWR
jgi:hypothetical protein